jgi:hypothetical protein
MAGRYGRDRKSYPLRLPVDVWVNLEVLYQRDVLRHGEMSMNTWLEQLLVDRITERRDELMLEKKKMMGVVRR